MNTKLTQSHVPAIIAALALTLITSAAHAEAGKNTSMQQRKLAPPKTSNWLDASSPYLAVSGKDAQPKPGEVKAQSANKLGNAEVQAIDSPRDVASGQATGK